jgi:hypothetical protein
MNDELAKYFEAWLHDNWGHTPEDLTWREVQVFLQEFYDELEEHN